MKKALKILSCTMGALLLLTVIVVNSISLTKLHDRSVKKYLKKEVKAVIQEETAGMDDEQILHYALKRTAKDLTFSRSGHVDCVYYARYCAEVFNYACRQNKLPSSIDAKPVVGKVWLWGIDVCDVLYGLTGDSFLMNHDVTEVHLSDRTVLVDANAYDYLFSDLSTTLTARPSGYR